MKTLIIVGLIFIFSISLISSDVNVGEINPNVRGVNIEPPVILTIRTFNFTGNLTNFTDLQDTPFDYSSQAGKLLIVNGDEDGLIFANNVSSGGGGGNTNGNFSEAYEVTRGTGGLNYTKTINASSVIMSSNF